MTKFENGPKEPAEVSHRIPNTVAILAGDAVAGQALELLLQGAGYNTRFVAGTVIDKLAEALDGVRLLILAPTLSVKHREDFLNSMRDTPTTAKIPVLELITALDGTQAEQNGRVLWPCRMEDLKGKIEAALLNGFAR